MDGEGNGSVTMETVGRHGSTKTRHGSTKTSGRIIADSMDVSSGRKNIESDMINETIKKGEQGKEWKKEEWERHDERYDNHSGHGKEWGDRDDGKNHGGERRQERNGRTVMMESKGMEAKTPKKRGC